MCFDACVCGSGCSGGGRLPPASFLLKAAASSSMLGAIVGEAVGVSVGEALGAGVAGGDLTKTSAGWNA